MDILINRAIRGFDQDALDKLCADYDDLSEQQTFIIEDFSTEFESAKAFLRELVDRDPQTVDTLKVQSHLYTLWGYLILAKGSITAEHFLPKYKQFMMDVSAQMENIGTNDNKFYNQEVAFYAANTRGAVTDLAPRQARHDALLAIIAQ